MGTKQNKRLLASALVAGSIVFPALQSPVHAEGPSYIEVENNVGTNDTVTFKNTKAKDTVKVYNADGSILLGKGVSSSKGGDLTIKLKDQFTEPTIQVTLTNYNKKESEMVEVEVPDETITDALSSDDLAVNNNVGTSDTVSVKEVKAKDTVKVYNASGETLLGSAKATKTGSLTVKLKSQLTEGYVQVSLSTYNSLESEKTDVEVPDEMITDALLPANIVVNNNTGAPDTVAVNNLFAKDIVKVYDASGENLLGTAKATKNGGVIVKLKAPLAEDTIQLSVTSFGKLESEKVEASVSGDFISQMVPTDMVIVNNNVNVADTVLVQGVAAKDVIKVYDASGEIMLGTAKASKAGDVIVKLKTQLAEDTIQVTLTSYYSLESEQVEVEVPEEETTELPLN
ncbi:hypothetical protein P4361_01575 [Fictibacillus sp. B-59209]|uniref:hypothetical protein n=1 Tax=Fictibacillus sp. B-59209 TaxID=3024873 RepID=UPI002E234E6F|nr:hypothetical protein [Fictibacillus sp. B-59209]